MANDDSTRPGFDLSPWLGRDPLTISAAACLWYGLKPGMTDALTKLYPTEWANTESRAAHMAEAAEAGRLPIQGKVPTRPVQTSRGVSGSAYLGRPGRPAEHREVANWGAALVALADLRSYAESIGERPAFFFPDAPAPKTSAAALDGRQTAPALDTKEPPQEWRNGLKRIAYEEAVKLVQEHGVLHGPALWAAMKARDDVKEAGRDSDHIEPRVCVNGWTRGEARIGKTQVQNGWRKELAKLLQ